MAHHVHDVTPEPGNYTTTRDVTQPMTTGCVQNVSTAASQAPWNLGLFRRFRRMGPGDLQRPDQTVLDLMTASIVRDTVMVASSAAR